MKIYTAIIRDNFSGYQFVCDATTPAARITWLISLMDTFYSEKARGLDIKDWREWELV